MRYKCIKDFWMEDTSKEEGFKPAFAKGEVYDFRRKGLDFVTDKDHCGHVHYMPTEDINNYFELVEEGEESMNKWQEGKRYKLKPSKFSKFIDENATNKRISNVIGDGVFTVKTVNSAGRVLELVEYSADPLDLCYWFSQSELDFFEIVETSNEDTIIDTFLEKLQYVLLTDSSVGDYVSTSGHSGVLNIETDHGTIYGVPSIRSFITNRYDQMQKEFKHKKNNELLERKAKLEAELAEVNKELGNV